MKVTRREKEVINLIAQELTTKEIAAQLYISNSTVTSHRKNAMEKLKAKNAAGLISKSYRHGILHFALFFFFATMSLCQSPPIGLDVSNGLDVSFGNAQENGGIQLYWSAELGTLFAGTSTSFFAGNKNWDLDSTGQLSTIFGLGNRSKSNASMLWGEGNFVDTGSSYATAFGFFNTVSDSSSHCTLWGSGNGTQSHHATVWGNSNQVQSDAIMSTIWGENNSASNQFSTAFGTFNRALGDHATVWGQDNIASGSYSTAFGLRTHANGPGSISTGLDTRAGGNYSTALGVGNVSKGFSSLVAGRYCDTIIADDQFLFDDTTPIFVLGNGTANNSRSNALSVFGNGRMKLGKGTATTDLHIKQSETTPNAGSGGILLEHSDNDSYWQIHYSGDNLSFTKDGIRRAYINPEGSVVDAFNPSQRILKTQLDDEIELIQSIIIGKETNNSNLRIAIDEADFIKKNADLLLYNESGEPIAIDYKQLYLTAIAALQEEIKVNRKQQELIDHIIGHLNLTK